MAAQNPLFTAGIQAVEGSADARSIQLLERGRERFPDDRDLAYLLAVQYRKAGQNDEAAAVYSELLRTQPSDPVSLNNLANVSFAAGEFAAAVPRYQQGLASAPTPAIGATLYYNMSLAYLQKFDPQPANEARSQAIRRVRRFVEVRDQERERRRRPEPDGGRAVGEVRAPARRCRPAERDGQG
jgi:tetratricopeptide (TPR) repeat protein